MFYVYIIRSQKDGRLYTGFTSNLQERLKYHNQGRVKTTRNRRPFELVFQEIYESREEAIKREKFLKSLKGAKIVKKNLLFTPR